MSRFYTDCLIVYCQNLYLLYHMRLMRMRLTNHLMRVRKALIVMMLTAHSKSNSPLVNKCFTIIQTHSISIALAHLNGSSSEHETSESDTEGYEFYFKLVRPRLIPHSVLGRLLRVGQNPIKEIIYHMLQIHVHTLVNTR